MSEVKNADLTRAFALIEADRLDEARTLLELHLKPEAAHADAWWLYAHAVTEPSEAQAALRTLVKLDSSYPGAAALLRETEQVATPKATGGITALGVRSATEPTTTTGDFLEPFDDDDLLDDDFDDNDDETETDIEPAPSRLRQIGFLAAAVIITLLLIGAAVLVTNQSRQRDSVPTAAITQSAAVTSAVTSSVTPNPASSDFSLIYDALAGFTVIENSAVVEPSTLGETFTVAVCNDPELGLPKTTLDAINIVAQQAELFVGQAEFVGAKIVDCAQNNRVLRAFAISIEDAQAFASGDLTAAELQSKLRNIQ
ncbi:MAG: hypothetical protein H7Y11_13635 [Armatimonadetes bacterium]|nr:hypothetical protein [Anaerolineae bacterium]